MKLTSTMLTTIRLIGKSGKTTGYGYAINIYPRRNLRTGTVQALIQRGLLEDSGETLNVGITLDGLKGHHVPLYRLSDAGKQQLAEVSHD